MVTMGMEMAMARGRFLQQQQQQKHQQREVCDSVQTGSKQITVVT